MSRRIMDGLSCYQRYRKRNAEKVRAARRDYGRRHPKEMAEAMRRWRKSHPHYYRDVMRRKRAKDPAAHAAYKRQYRQLNREAIRAYEKRYRKEKPHLFIANSALRRARKRAVSVNPAAIADLISRTRAKRVVRCYYYRKRIKVREPRELQADHVIALVANGPHEIGNIAITCAACNRSKHDKSLLDWQPPTAQKVLAL